MGDAAGGGPPPARSGRDPLGIVWGEHGRGEAVTEPVK
jgi:hypothetical protein